MRILYCNKYNFSFSGTEVYLFELMKMMRAQGHEVALFSMADPRGETTPYDQHFAPPVDFKKEGVGLLGRSKLAAHAIYSHEARRRLQRMIADFQPDVAHVRNIYHHLSVDPVGVKKEQYPCAVSLERLQAALPQLQPGGQGQGV